MQKKRKSGKKRNSGKKAEEVATLTSSLAL
jgi:hypothetical protein